MPSSGLCSSDQIGRAHVWNSSHTIISYAVFCLKKSELRTGDGAHVAGVPVGAAGGRAWPDGSAARPRPAPRPLAVLQSSLRSLLFFFNDTATTEIYTLSLHDALPI